MLSDEGPFGLVLDETTSTNDEATRLAEAGAQEGTWVVADHQSAGRGRRGRVWSSPSGTGLYLSVIIRPDPPQDGSLHGDAVTSILTLLAGVAVVEGVRIVSGVEAGLRWPNDVVVERAEADGRMVPRKLAGILAEGATTGGELQHVIVGIGINLRPAVHPGVLDGRAISIEELAGRVVDRDLVRDEVLSELMAWRRRVRYEGSAAVLDAWRELARGSSGQQVSWDHPGGRKSGTTEGIDEDGALLVRTGGGVERIVAGELTWE